MALRPSGPMFSNTQGRFGVNTSMGWGPVLGVPPQGRVRQSGDTGDTACT
jgi:hypothetical protein